MGKFKELAYELSQSHDIMSDADIDAALKQYYVDEDARIKQLEIKAAKYDLLVTRVYYGLIVVSSLGLGSMIVRIVL